jgi:hypothetical protein
MEKVIVQSCLDLETTGGPFSLMPTKHCQVIKRHHHELQDRGIDELVMSFQHFPRGKCRLDPAKCRHQHLYC